MAYLAIDIGGSAIKAGLVTADGDLLDRMSITTPMESYDALLDSLASIVEWAREITWISGLALSQPCATDSESALALSEGALGYIKHRNPAKDIGQRYQLPYSAENDGNCAALAEVWIGSAKEVSDMAFVVCGTGVGGAVVKDRKVHSGSKKFAGEFGMMITSFDSDTKKPVMWSESGSTYALVKNYARCMNIDRNKVNGHLIFERADSGEAVAKACIQEFYKMFAVGLHNIQHVYDPEVILIGGGISTRKSLIEELNCEIEKLYEGFELVASKPILKACSFTADANLIGAVYHHLSSKVRP